MITLGLIEEIDIYSNMCKVKLPTLEGAGNMTEVSLHATQLLPPGIDAGYEKGDVVFVGFVDNTLGRPVVLGQLYRGPNKGHKVDGMNIDTSLGRAATMACANLDVSEDAKVNGVSVVGLNNKIAALEAKVKELETKLKALK